jgi:hypothetical protein
MAFKVHSIWIALLATRRLWLAAYLGAAWFILGTKYENDNQAILVQWLVEISKGNVLIPCLCKNKQERKKELL